MHRLDEAVRDYSKQFDVFMAMLGEQAGDEGGSGGSGASPQSGGVDRDFADNMGMYRFLALRLDYNRYHEHQRRSGQTSVATNTPPVIGTGRGGGGGYSSTAGAGARLSFS